MYIETLELNRIKTFSRQKLVFVHPDMDFWPRKQIGDRPKDALPKPLLPNVNLLLGNNGSGKTSVLRAIAMSVLGPSFTDSKLPIQGLIRRSTAKGSSPERGDPTIDSRLRLHPQDGTQANFVNSVFGLKQKGELERITYFDSGGKIWNPVFESKNPAFFSAGYGATRRVEPPDNIESFTRPRSAFMRAQRLQGLFVESYTLVPLETWLPLEKDLNPGRCQEVGNLLNKLMEPGAYRFTGEQENGVDFAFNSGGTNVPFRWLSDGYKAFVGWAGDLLYHASICCPADTKLSDLYGIVMVDDVDLQLHPKWQMKVIKTIATAFPNIQFIFTSHSPLVAGTVEWMNILTLQVKTRSNSTVVRRLSESIHGLDADQVLVSDFFGLSSTRAGEKRSKLHELTIRARRGDEEAAGKLMEELAKGTEEE